MSLVNAIKSLILLRDRSDLIYISESEVEHAITDMLADFNDRISVLEREQPKSFERFFEVRARVQALEETAGISNDD